CTPALRKFSGILLREACGFDQRSDVRGRGELTTNAKSLRKLWGFLVRKERWGLSWSGRLILVLLGFSTAGFLFLNIERFLAESYCVDADVLLVEGWIYEYAIRVAVVEFWRGVY